MRTTPSALLAVSAVCALAFVPRALHGQALETISGRVTDARGFGLAHAHVDVTDQQTGRTVAVLTRPDGSYSVSGLAAGHRFEVMMRQIGYSPISQIAPPADAAPVTAAATAAPAAPTEGRDLDPIVDGTMVPIGGAVRVAKR